jgi:hypothetical protein
VAILDAHKTGHHYEYLVRFSDTSEDEDAWVPLSDIPRTANELLEWFHRHHPRAPRPQRVVLDQTYPVNDPTPTPSSSTFPSPVSDPTPSPSTAIPPVSRWTPTLPPMRENLRSNYVAPTSTTSRSGHVSRPPDRLNPVHVVKPPTRRKT